MLLMINPQQASRTIPAIIRMALSKFFLSQSITNYFLGSDGVGKSMISMRIEALTSSRPRITFNSLEIVPPAQLPLRCFGGKPADPRALYFER